MLFCKERGEISRTVLQEYGSECRVYFLDRLQLVKIPHPDIEPTKNAIVLRERLDEIPLDGSPLTGKASPKIELVRFHLHAAAELLIKLSDNQFREKFSVTPVHVEQATKGMMYEQEYLPPSSITTYVERGDVDSNLKMYAFNQLRKIGLAFDWLGDNLHRPQERSLVCLELFDMVAPEFIKKASDLPPSHERSHLFRHIAWLMHFGTYAPTPIPPIGHTTKEVLVPHSATGTVREIRIDLLSFWSTIQNTIHEVSPKYWGRILNSEQKKEIRRARSIFGKQYNPKIAFNITQADSCKNFGIDSSVTSEILKYLSIINARTGIEHK